MYSANPLPVQSGECEPRGDRRGPTNRYRVPSLTESEQSQWLSSILSVYTLPDTFSDAETFRARVMLRVSRRKVPPTNQASWVWYVVPVSLICALVLADGLLSLAGALGLITGTVWWGVVGDASQAGSALSGWIDSNGVLGEVFGSSLPFLLYVLPQMIMGSGLILVFLSYAGWVSMLWRAGTRPAVPKGERNGTL